MNNRVKACDKKLLYDGTFGILMGKEALCFFYQGFVSLAYEKVTLKRSSRTNAFSGGNVIAGAETGGGGKLNLLFALGDESFCVETAGGG